MDEDTTILLTHCGEAVTDHEQSNDNVVSAGDVLVAPSVGSGCSLVVWASLVAAAGGLLFGYDLGVISGALLVMQQQLGLSCQQSEAVVSVMMAGALMASLLGGWVVDRIGRKYAIIMNAVLFAIGAVTLATSGSFLVIILGRLLVGFAVSLSAVSECVYISEIAPVNRRGQLVSLNELAITVGFLLSYLADHMLINLPDGWRYMFGLSLIPAVFQVVAMLFLPRTPHFLLLQKKERQAEAVLQRLTASTDVKQQLVLVRLAVSDAVGSSSERRLCGLCGLSGDAGALWPSFVVAIVLVVSQQACGQPTLLNYAPAVLRLVGYCADSAATMATVGLGVVKVLATCLALFYVDRVGRRKLLLAGTLLMFLCLLALSMLTYSSRARGFSTGAPLCLDSQIPGAQSAPRNKERLLEPLPSPLSLLASDSDLGGSPVRNTSIAGQRTTTTEFGIEVDGRFINLTTAIITAVVSGVEDDRGVTEPAKTTESQLLQCSGLYGWRPLAALVSMMGIVAGYSLGFGPITWLVLSEIFPPAVKGRALALSTALNWLVNMVVSATFLQSVDILSLCGVFSVYGAVCLLACVFIFFAVPETRNKAFHEISAELRPGRWLRSCCGNHSRRGRRKTRDYCQLNQHLM